MRAILTPIAPVALALALVACRALPVAPTQNDAASGGPPTGQASWLAPPAPGWALIVQEAANATVMLHEPSLRREGDSRTALILINYIRPAQRLGGLWLRSEVSGIEADCAARTYRLAGRRLHSGHGGAGEAIAAVPPDPAAPMRPVQPGSLAEDVLAALCAPASASPGA